MTSVMIIDFGIAFWLGMVGGCIGSFLNVVAFRLPRRISIVWKPSYCPHCQQPIRARDNVPVLGWLLLRGRCRDCGGAISPRYAIVEAAMALAFFLLACSLLWGAGPGYLPASQWELGEEPPFWSNWPGVTWYAHHTLLLSLLMCVVLFDCDSEPAPLRFAAFALAVSIASTALVLSNHADEFILLGQAFDPSAFDALWGACAGLFIGAGISIVVRGKPLPATGNEQPLERRGTLIRRPENAIVSGTLVGFYLGAGAVTRTTAVAIVVAFLAARFWHTERNRLMMPLLWCATLLHLVFWQQVLNYSPW